MDADELVKFRHRRTNSHSAWKPQPSGLLVPVPVQVTASPSGLLVPVR